MSSIIFLICVLIGFARAVCGADMTGVDEIYGKDKYCHLAFSGAVDPGRMKECNSPQAQPFGPATIGGCRFGYVLSNDGIIDALIADEGNNACGMAYLVPTADFAKLNNPNEYPPYETVDISVTVKGKPVPVKCNVFQGIIPSGFDEPAVPPQYITDQTAAYKAGGLSNDCINKLKNIPTTDNNSTPPADNKGTPPQDNKGNSPP